MHIVPGKVLTSSGSATTVRPQRPSRPKTIAIATTTHTSTRPIAAYGSHRDAIRQRCIGRTSKDEKNEAAITAVSGAGRKARKIR